MLVRLTGDILTARKRLHDLPLNNRSKIATMRSKGQNSVTKAPNKRASMKGPRACLSNRESRTSLLICTPTPEQVTKLFVVLTCAPVVRGTDPRSTRDEVGQICDQLHDRRRRHRDLEA